MVTDAGGWEDGVDMVWLFLGKVLAGGGWDEEAVSVK
jgi:hypothetical protein